jgi:choline dehydrogenase-like flavoprotein
MLIDLAEHRPDFSAIIFDACIIGGGVAGITLALKLGQAGRRVLLVEAGDQSSSAKSQAYYSGDLGSLENLPLDTTRIRALGGSSQHWGGWCRAFDAYDFARSDLSPDGAWPISKPDLDPYSREAATILGVTESSGVDAALADTDGNLQTIRMSFSKPPKNMGANYFDKLRQSENVSFVLNAPYLSAALDANNPIINWIAVRDPRWRISDDDRVAMRAAALEFGRYLIHADIGRLNVNPAILSLVNPLQGWTALSGASGAAGHQLGGARMSSKAADGVVDKDCRVWSVNNLYVAGSAVFRTSSHATPTFTITQLALRLADTLNHRLPS